jgi:hypothetical protein
LIQRLSIAVIAIFFLLQSCTFSANGFSVYKNDHIEKEKRDLIKKLNDRLIQSIKNNNIESIKSIMSDQLLQITGTKIDSTISQVSAYFTTSSYSILDEFDIHNTEENNSSSISSNDFTIHFIALNKDVYVSLLDIKDSIRDILVTAIYGNYSGKWKLNILQFGRYKLFGRDALYYYGLSKSDFEQSYLMNAVVHMLIAKELSKPVNNYSAYLLQPEMEKLDHKIIQAVEDKYKFPLVFEDIKTKPSFFKIRNYVSYSESYPVMQYLSSISLSDTLALKTEYEILKKEVYKTFTGLNKNKHVLFQAFNEIPNDGHNAKAYGFLDTLYY